MRRLYYAAALLLLPWGASPQSLKTHALPKVPDTTYRQAQFTARAFRTANHTFGYNIFMNNALVIHQPVIPCYGGSSGFRSEKEAMLVAALVISKMKKGLLPPTVTRQELAKLGIRAS